MGGFMPEDKNDQRENQSLLRVFTSVFASMFGVQSNRNREEDFARGSAAAYITVGVVATLLFILAVWGVVKLVMSIANPS
jgi:hypothetical protein